MTGGTRRILLKTGGVVAVGGLSGCLGSSTEEVSCDGAAAILVRQTYVVDVTVPFDQYNETLAVVATLEDQGYTATIYVDYDPSGPETQTVEILGQIEVDEVRRIANEHELTVVSIESGTSGDTAFSDIDSSWIWPWETPLLVDRVEEYQAAAERLSVSIPTLSAKKTEISILETQDKSLESAIEHVRTAFKPSGQISVEFESPVPVNSYGRGYDFESSIGHDDFITRPIVYQSQGQQYEVRAQVKGNRYMRYMFGPTFQVNLPDSIVDGGNGDSDGWRGCPTAITDGVRTSAFRVVFGEQRTANSS